MKINGTIYCITNIANGTKYIGQTKIGANNRLAKHIKASDGGNMILNKAIRKYGKDNFVIEEIETGIKSQRELDEKEINYIKEYKSKYNLYNVADGGVGGNGNKKLSEDEVIKIKHLLKHSELSFSEISNMFNVGLFAISDINRGKSWKDNSFKGHIRNTSRAKRIPEDIVINILNDLMYTSLSTIQIAKKYNLNTSTIQAISNGEIHLNNNIKYPLRDKVSRPTTSLRLSKANVKEIINILQNSCVLIKDIGKKYNVSPNTIADINHGRSWRELYNGEYPIRKKV